MYAELERRLAEQCIPCFQGLCDMCIAARGTGGDGQPCRCAHAYYYQRMQETQP